MASLRDWTRSNGGQVSRTTCPVRTIDDLVDSDEIPRPDFIKCDIEGGEPDCFKGGRDTLERVDAPVILFEANVNSAKGYGNAVTTGVDFLAALKDAEYSFFVVTEDASLRPVDFENFWHGNVLAIPHARMDRVGPMVVNG